MANKRRAQPRVNASLKARLRLADGSTLETTQIANISLGGVFIQMDDPLPFGSEFDLEFSLPGPQRAIRCAGFVAWSTRTAPERKGPLGEGIGVRLTGIGIADMRSLAEFIEDKLGS